MMVGLKFLGYHNDRHFDNKTVLGFAMRVTISPYVPKSPSYPKFFCLTRNEKSVKFRKK